MIATLCLALATNAAAPESMPSLRQEQGEPAAQSSAPSSRFSYTYIQGDIIRGDGDGFFGGPDGLDILGSYALTKEFFVFGGIEHLDGDIGAEDVDWTKIGAGLGFHMPASPSTDVVFSLGFMHSDADSNAPGWSPDGTGYGVDVGVRHAADEKVEINGGVGYQNFDDSSSMTSIHGGLVYKVSKNVGVCGGLSFSSEFDQMTVGVRWQP